MKIIKIIFFTLLALGLIASTAVFLFFQIFDTDQYLPKITRKVSLALGRPVSIGGVGLGLSLAGITLDAGPVIVTDDAAFTTQPFIKIDKARLSLDLKSLVLHREINITQILLQSPQIHFIRSRDGNINARSVRYLKQPVKIPNGSMASKESTDQSLKESIPASFTANKSKEPFDSIKSIKIRDGAISFIDQNQSFPVDIWLSDINANLKSFSLSKPFRLSFKACLYSDLPNVHGSAMLDLSKKMTVVFSDLRLNINLLSPDINRIRGISPDMADSPVFKDITGMVRLNATDLQITPENLTADGELSVTDAVIKDFNVLKMLLSHELGLLGGIDINIDRLLNGQSKLAAPDTDIEKADTKFSLHDKTLFVDNLLVQTNIFEFTATGSLDQRLSLDMQTMLHLNADVSAVLINQFDALKFLSDDGKRVAIGATLKGVMPHLKYKPNKDFRKKSRKALMEEGGNILGILLGGR